jgi:hypothetical protein
MHGIDGAIVDEDDTQQALVAGITLFVGVRFPDWDLTRKGQIAIMSI